MSTFIWGKTKLSNKCVINDMRIKNISVFFTEEKTDLFIVGLEENEVYFNIVCGYEGLSRSSWDKLHYHNCDDAFFSIGALRKTDDFSECLKKLHGRLLDLQHAIEDILINDNVEGIDFYYTDDGDVDSIDEYEPVDWPIEDFADRFFAEIMKNKGLGPTIKAVFPKKHDGSKIGGMVGV